MRAPGLFRISNHPRPTRGKWGSAPLRICLFYIRCISETHLFHVRHTSVAHVVFSFQVADRQGTRFPGSFLSVFETCSPGAGTGERPIHPIEVPSRNPPPVDHFPEKSFKYLTRCARGADTPPMLRRTVDMWCPPSRVSNRPPGVPGDGSRGSFETQEAQPKPWLSAPSPSLSQSLTLPPLPRVTVGLTGDTSAQILTPSPPPPIHTHRRYKMLRRSGPYSAPTWPEMFFRRRWGVCRFYPMSVYTKCSQFCGESKHVRKICKPLTSPSQPPKPGCWDRTPQGVKGFFSKPPHMCGQNDQRNEGIILGHTYVGVPRTPPRRPPGPLQGPPPPPTHKAQKVYGAIGVRI